MVAKTEALDVPKWRIEIAAMIAKGEKFPEGKIMESIKEFANRHTANWQTVRTAYYQYQNRIPATILDVLTDPKRSGLSAAGDTENDETPGDTENETPITGEQQAPEQTEDDPQPEQGETQQEKPESKKEEPKPMNTAAATTTGGSDGAAKGSKVPGLKRDDPDYPAGKVIEVKVTELLTHGAVVQTVDENKMDGFIYIGNVAPKYVSDINKYFRIGDVVHAQVRHIDEMKGRIDLSTRSLPMKEHGVQNLTHESIETKKDRELRDREEQEKKTTLRSLEDLAMFKDQIATEEAAQPETKPAAAPAAAEQAIPKVPAILASEMEDVKSFVKQAIGWDPSEAALSAFAKLFSNHGMFKTTLALGKETQGFEVDLGLLLAQQVEKRLSGATFRG